MKHIQIVIIKRQDPPTTVMNPPRNPAPAPKVRIL